MVKRITWTNHDLTPLVVGLGSQKGKTTHTPQEWRKLKRKLISEQGSRCGYCGGEYDKYLYCCHRDHHREHNQKENLIIACRLCYSATHLHPNLVKEAVTACSELSQKEINRRTVNHYLKKGTIPTIEQIDPKARRAPVSLVELLDLLAEDKCPFPQLRLFFTPFLETNFLDQIIGSEEKQLQLYLIDEEIEEEDYDYYLKYQDITQHLPEYELTSRENRWIQQKIYPSSHSIQNNLVHLQEVIDESKLYEQAEQQLNQAYQQVLEKTNIPLI